MPSNTDRRARILDAAERLLSHYGPDKTTMADVAREANVGVGSVYLEFDSKNTIIRELTAGRHAAVLEAMASAATTSARSGERLRNMMVARTRSMRAMDDEGLHARDLLRCACPAVADEYERFARAERDLVRQVIEEGVAEGELETPDPGLAASVFIDAHRMFSPPELFEWTETELEQRMAVLHELLIRGLSS